MARSRKARGAFTIVETTIVVGIMALLVALILPAIQKAREAARRAQCQCHLKQLALALQNYNSAWSVFPPGYVSEMRPVADGPGEIEIGRGWAWAPLVLPFLEDATLYNAINFDRPIASSESWTVRTAALGFFVCPSEGRRGPANFHATSVSGLPADLAPTSYVGCGGTIVDPPADGGDGVFGRNVARKLGDVTDGTSNTILLGERSRDLADASWIGVIPGAVHATEPSWPVRSSGHSCAMVLGFTDPSHASPRGLNSMQAGHAAFRGPHPGGANFAMVDGSVRLLKDSLEPARFCALATHAGGEVISCDCY